MIWYPAVDSWFEPYAYQADAEYMGPYVYKDGDQLATTSMITAMRNTIISPRNITNLLRRLPNRYLPILIMMKLLIVLCRPVRCRS